MAWIRLDLPEAEILFSDRTGGVSAPPFDTANAGYSRGDDPGNVDENRVRIGAGLGGRVSDPAEWISLHQVHGAVVYPADVAGPTTGHPAPYADASVSAEPGAVLSVLTADCGPVALVAPGVVAAVHAGWRGVAAGVLEAAVAEVRRRGSGAVRAVLGPCIHPECYEFSPADLAPIAERLGREVVSHHRRRSPGARRSAGDPAGAGRGRGDRRDRRRRVHGLLARPLLAPARRSDGPSDHAGGGEVNATVTRPEDVADRLAEVRQRMAEAADRAGRSVSEVRLVVVTKGVSPPVMQAVLDAGATDLGENRAQEMLAKAPELSRLAGDSPNPKVPAWHFIGRLQRNKVAALAPLVDLWQSVDRLELGQAIAGRAPGAAVLAEVNVADDPAKAGVAPGEAPALVDGLRAAGLAVDGLMTVPAAGRDPRPAFAALAELAERLGLAEVSMGMSDDFEMAVEEGATIVRVGRAIFGPRIPGAEPHPRSGTAESATIGMAREGGQFDGCDVAAGNGVPGPRRRAGR